MEILNSGKSFSIKFQIRKFYFDFDRVILAPKIKYSTSFGQTVCILGNIPELGNWSELRGTHNPLYLIFNINLFPPLKPIFKLTWQEGDIWTGSIIVDSSVFCYKYAILDEQDNIIRWEAGLNRIADLNEAERIQPHEEYIFNDIWERFEIVFQLLHDFSGEEKFELTVSEPPLLLHTWNENGKPLVMNLCGKGRYYDSAPLVNLYQATIHCDQSTVAKLSNLEYVYNIRFTETDIVIFQREKTRLVKICDPEECRCIYNKHTDNNRGSFAFEPKPKIDWRPIYKSFIVNGRLLRTDKDFVYKFETTELPKINCLVGPYPQSKEDVKLLHELGVTAVLCVQSQGDFNRRGIDVEGIKKYYGEYEIKYIHKPILDFDEEELKKNLKIGIETLFDLLENQSQRVFIHCTMGIYRSVSILLGYLAIYKGFTVESAFEFIKEHRSGIVPSLEVIKSVVENYSC